MTQAAAHTPLPWSIDFAARDSGDESERYLIDEARRLVAKHEGSA